MSSRKARAALHASLEAGRPVDVAVESIAANSLGARNTGSAECSILPKTNVDHVALVTDDAICRGPAPALGKAARRRLSPAARPRSLRLRLEPTSRARSRKICGVLLCGANVDLAKLAGVAS